MKNVIQKIQNQIKDGLFTNEAAVIRGIINPILQKLNWPIDDVSIVRPEYTVENRRIDIAIFYNNQPHIFIEAKKIGGTDGAERQLFEYAFHLGVPILILTDGSTWHFFLSSGIGSYEQRKVNKLDLIEYEDLEQLCSKFFDYLDYNNVISGKSLKILQKDYDDINRVREIEKTIPIAWKKIIDENDDLLFELIANKVEELCNYKPQNDLIFNFFSKLNSDSVTPLTPKIITSEPQKMKIKPSGSLGFTRIINCSFGGNNPGNRWANLITAGISIAVKMGYSINDLQRHTTINLIRGEVHERGFKFIPKTGLSYQGMDANKTWDNALKLAQLTKQKIYVEFEWTNNPNAVYPNKKETLFWQP